MCTMFRLPNKWLCFRSFLTVPVITVRSFPDIKQKKSELINIHILFGNRRSIKIRAKIYQCHLMQNKLSSLAENGKQQTKTVRTPPAAKKSLFDTKSPRKDEQ